MFESLTQLNYDMLKSLKIFKKSDKIFGCWSKNGTIFLKKGENDDPIKIKSMTQISNLSFD